MPRELANDSRTGRRKRDIRTVPEFMLHLERTGLSFDEWERRQQSGTPSADADLEALALQRRRVGMNRR